MFHSKRNCTIFSISTLLAENSASGCIKLAMFSVCVWSVWSGVLQSKNCIQATATATPKVLPASFMTDRTLLKLRNQLCKRCGTAKRNICNEFSNGDVCHLICGCNNYNDKCLATASCTCPLKLDAGCKQGVAVCEFDDAVVCSTSKEICMYYDEAKIHCDCLEGWTGVNCQTCDQQLSVCDGLVEDTSGDEPASSGSDLTVKVLVVACAVCLLIGVLLGIICVCRPGKLVVCITRNFGRQKGEEAKRTTEEPNQTTVAPAKHNEHDYCHIGGQYAVPDTHPTSSGNTVATVRYTEPTQRNQDASRTDDPNYYFKLEPSAGIVTYESVALIVEDKNKPRSAISAESSPEKPNESIYSSGQKHLNKPKEDKVQSSSSPKALCQTTTTLDDNYDHLERKVGVTSDTDTGFYSHLKLTT
ncbi:uncharacterized protein [Asterias amurensis]|uniref:uncharacterized protein n=1 Tax=Asterias amurensis TaxID=7602 RepID=UPI003AB4339D